MATTLHRVLENFRWRVESAVPTCDIPGKGFHRLDPTKLAETDSQGLERGFTVRLVGGGDDLEATCAAYRSSVYTVLLVVIYSPGRGEETTQEVIAQDQFDLAQALRDDRLYVGWSADNPTDELQIVARELKSQTVDYSDDEIWLLQQEWLVQLTEVA